MGPVGITLKLSFKNLDILKPFFSQTNHCYHVEVSVGLKKSFSTYIYFAICSWWVRLGYSKEILHGTYRMFVNLLCVMPGHVWVFLLMKTILFHTQCALNVSSVDHMLTTGPIPIDVYPSSFMLISQLNWYYCVSLWKRVNSWYRHGTETFPALLALCEGIYCQIPSQRASDLQY